MTEREWEIWNEEHVDRLVSDGWAKNGGGDGGAMKIILKHLEGTSLLDVGCGVGRLGKHLPKKYKYLGVDTSEAMLKHARKFVPGREFRVGDAYDLGGLPVFDTVVGCAILIHLPDPLRALKEMWKHCKRCVIVTVKLNNEEIVRECPEIATDKHGGKSVFDEGKHIVIHHESEDSFAEKIGQLEGVVKVETWNAPKVRVYKIWKDKP